MIYQKKGLTYLERMQQVPLFRVLVEKLPLNFNIQGKKVVLYIIALAVKYSKTKNHEWSSTLYM